MMRFATCLALIIAITAMSRAGAVEALDAETLLDQCRGFDANPDTGSERLCVAYINGFLDGAVATDARVAENVADEIERTEGFTERAIRTRVIRRLEVTGPTGYAEFCVGKPVPIVDVVAHVNAEFERHGSLAGLKAQDIVYDALRRQYPCRPAQ